MLMATVLWNRKTSVHSTGLCGTARIPWTIRHNSNIHLNRESVACRTILIKYWNILHWKHTTAKTTRVQFVSNLILIGFHLCTFLFQFHPVCNRFWTSRQIFLVDGVETTTTPGRMTTFLSLFFFFFIVFVSMPVVLMLMAQTTAQSNNVPCMRL